MTPGRMMDFPLTLTHLLDRARRYFPQTEIVSRGPDGKLHRQTWSDIYDALGEARARARAARREAGRPRRRRSRGTTTGTSRPTSRVPMMGAVVHTLNLRLHPTEIGYIARHAEDSVVLVDRSLLPLFDQFVDAACPRSGTSS